MRTLLKKGQPGLNDVHVNYALTNILVGYVQSLDSFVAPIVFPTIPVQQKSNFYWVYSKEDFLRDEAKVRAAGTESAGGGFGLTTQSYNCIVEAYHKDLADMILANADSALNLETAAARFVGAKLAIRRERRWVASFFVPGVWGTDMVGVVAAPAAGQFIQWDQAASTPLADIEVGKLAMMGTTGYAPNTLVLGPQVFSKLKDNAKIRDQFKYTSADSIDLAMMAQFFGLKRIVVANGVYTSTAEGAAVQTTGFIAGKNALLCYTPDAPSVLEPAAGYTFSWSGYTGSVDGYALSRFRMPELRVDRLEGEIAYDMRVIAPAMGYFLGGVVA